MHLSVGTMRSWIRMRGLSRHLSRPCGRGSVHTSSGLTRRGAFQSLRCFSNEGFQCPACGAPSSPLVCRSCGRLHESSSSGSFFELLGSSTQSTSSEDPRSEQYLRGETSRGGQLLQGRPFVESHQDLQRLLHPDRHVAGTEEQRELADSHSAHVNEAAAVLRSPLRRAQYWMELNGQKILLEEQRIEDMQTMMEVMETSEELDAAKTQSEVDGLRQRNRSKIESVESELSEIFKHEDWMTARHRVERLQMLTRLQERMDDWRPK
ncbi:unnamed protein product [Durusdinium trenchii]|uniref:Co-chaperone HscB C-terminal oligomerisation domain-containing protein n=1 Tax=Durusdinium trenchii TaxID=1381693 RepID=A0ABP0N748_9DINO